MFSTRRILAVTALCAVTLLSGCSGGDDSSDGSTNPGDSGSGSASSSESPEQPEAPCEATVEVTGKVNASWSGGGNLLENGDQVTYSTSEGEANLLVASGTKKQPSTLTFALSGDVFVGKPGAKGVQADRKGSGAEVDADVTGQVKGKPATAHVVATFECDAS